jgi:EipB-like
VGAGADRRQLSRANGSISRAQGKLEFEWADACSGWTVSQRTLVQLLSNEGQVIDFGWTLNSLESKDGTDYRFFIRRYNAGGGGDSQRGEAHLRGPGQGGTASYTEPAAKDIVLPKGTLFPTAHSLMLLDAAEGGGLPALRQVFDGSGDEGGLYSINASLSATLPQDTPVNLDSPLLKNQKSWRLHLAYFGQDESVSVPEHEQFFRIFATGVVDEMLLDYGDFTLRADLKSVEALPKPQC